MKNIMIGIAIIMTIGLVIGIYFYTQPPEAQKPQFQEPIEQPVPDQPEPLSPIIVNNHIGYSLQNDKLQITFDDGLTWISVPVEKESLFSGEYNGSERELIENSFIMTEDRVAFLHDNVKLTYSLDQGATWQDTVIAENFQAVRFRKVDFLNESFGYVILTGDRTMSQEWNAVYLTNDGGQTWNETNHSNNTRLLYDGGFVDEQTGFLSFGTINPEKPDFLVTQDAGQTWIESAIHIPEQYNLIFTTAEVPFLEDEHLAMFVNQGPNGDYKGGHVKGKFISKDHGLTWEFSMEVEPNEME